MDSAGNAYGPYDIEVAGSEAESFTEAGWARLNRDSGVYSGGALTFTGLTAHLAAIDMVVHGFYLQRTAEWTDASPATTGASPRRDMLVARRQLTSGEGAGAIPGKTFLTVLRGSPAATPADQAHDPVNDEPLWSWQVPGGGGTVITSQRDLRRPVASPGGPHGALCKPVTLAGSLGTNGSAVAVGATPQIRLDAGRLVRVAASFQLYIPSGNGQNAQVWLERWSAAGALQLQFGGQVKRIAATDLYDVTLDAEDEITAAGSYVWKVAGAMSGGALATVDATLVTGSVARQRTLRVSDAGPLPFV